MSTPLLEIDDVTIQYQIDDGHLTAVSDASFTVEEGSYFGLVGESGCGKSTLASSIIGGLDSNGKVTSGSIRYRGEEIHDMSEQELNEELRWNEISWIPQGSMSSLDPLERISSQAAEIARVHTDLSKEEAHDKLRELFDIVGLQPERITDYPHQFSGGMQQRALIALSLFLDPSIVIADEPTTALDVIMQDQVLKYFDKIKAEQNTSMILITHDISVVFETCDSMAIMHSGQVSERGSVTDVYDSPHHPYSILLQDAFPDIRHRDRELNTIENSPPKNVGEVNYCTFADRCPWAVDECSEHAPSLEPVSDADTDDTNAHAAACFRSDEDLLAQHRNLEGSQVKGGHER